MATDNDKTIKALLAERKGLVQYGKDDRVAQVDEELRKLGHTVEAPASDESAAQERAASQDQDEAPKRRGRPRQQTAEQPPKDET
jgi:hypothetical protein